MERMFEGFLSEIKSFHDISGKEVAIWQRIFSPPTLWPDEDEVLEYTTDPELIHEKWDHLVYLVINGGYGGNEPSTIVDLSEDEPLIVREGKGSLDIF